MTSPGRTVRPNPRGDWPEIDPSAYVDPTAQVIGLVQIGPRVFIGPNAIVRADEMDKEGEVEPIIVEAECNIQDGVIIHALAGTLVRIGTRTSLTHGSIVHGPCVLGPRCFVGFGATLYDVRAEEGVFVGTAAVVQGVSLAAETFVPPGSSVLCQEEAAELGMVGPSEREFMEKVIEANLRLTEGYRRLKQAEEGV